MQINQLTRNPKVCFCITFSFVSLVDLTVACCTKNCILHTAINKIKIVTYDYNQFKGIILLK